MKKDNTTIDDTRAHIEAIIKNVLQDEDTDCGNEILCSIIASRCAKEIMKALNLCEESDLTHPYV